MITSLNGAADAGGTGGHHEIPLQSGWFRAVMVCPTLLIDVEKWGCGVNWFGEVALLVLFCLYVMCGNRVGSGKASVRRRPHEGVCGRRFSI